jgi:hypothetical protein
MSMKEPKLSMTTLLPLLKSLAVATTVPMITVKPIKSQAQYTTDSHIHGLVVFVMKIMYTLYELAPLWQSFFD